MQRRDFFRWIALTGISAAAPVGFGGCAESRRVTSTPTSVTRTLRAYGRDGRWLELDRTTGVVRAVSGLVETELSLPTHASPVAIAIANDGRCAVADASSGSVSLFAPDDDVPTLTCGRPTFQEPRGLAFDSDGRLLVVDAASHRLVVLDAAGATVSDTGALGVGLGELNGPRAIALDAQGHAYVAECGNARVQVFAPNGRAIGTFGSYGRDDGQFLSPRAIAIDGDGCIHVADAIRGDVQVFERERFVARFAPADGVPVGLATRLDGGVDVLIA